MTNVGRDRESQHKSALQPEDGREKSDRPWRGDEQRADDASERRVGAEAVIPWGPLRWLSLQNARLAMILFVLLLFLALLFAVVFTRGGGPDSVLPSESPGGTVEQSAPDTQTGDGTSAAPTHAELAAQEPVELTEVPWRFFLTSAEESALYDFVFLDSGTFHESGATQDAGHNSGTYVDDGYTITLSLTRVDIGEASDGVNTRTEEISWSETFTMVRTGNTMRGLWKRQSWVFSYDDGMVYKGLMEPGPDVFARPQRSDDQG